MRRKFLSGSWLVLALLTACGKSGNESPGATSNSEAPRNAEVPIEISTPSGIEMVSLPAGEFVMGSAQGAPDEGPPHRVTLPAFLIDKFEVTHAMFTQVQLPNPSHWQDNPKKPVERVRWRDAKLYCNERSLLEKLKPCYNEKTPDFDCDYSANGYRLPTEAEWEYACRAGADASGPGDKLRSVAWFADNASEKTHPVGEKKPNRWGVFDLNGNVSEWCEDVYSPTYYQESPSADPHGPPSPGRDVKRVMRGGSWKASADMCRATARQGERTGDSDACFYTDYCGFRCVRRAAPGEIQSLIQSSKR